MSEDTILSVLGQNITASAVLAALSEGDVLSLVPPGKLGDRVLLKAERDAAVAALQR